MPPIDGRHGHGMVIEAGPALYMTKQEPTEVQEGRGHHTKLACEWHQFSTPYNNEAAGKLKSATPYGAPPPLRPESRMCKTEFELIFNC